MATGEILKLNTETGIGFIREAGEEHDILFHATALTEGTFDRLSKGQRVDFDHKGYAKTSIRSRAVNVRPIGPAG